MIVYNMRFKKNEVARLEPHIVKVHKDAEFLSAIVQNDEIVVYFQTEKYNDDHGLFIERRLVFTLTGHKYNRPDYDQLTKYELIDTVQFEEGTHFFVVHVFADKQIRGENHNDNV